MNAMPDFTRLADAPVGAILVLKATAVLLAAWLTTWGLSRANPRWRVLVWRAAVVGLAAVVVLATAPPLVTWRVASPLRTTPQPMSVASTSSAAPTPVFITPDSVDAFADRLVLSPAPPSPTFHSSAWLPAVWLGGVVVFGLRFAIGAWRLSRVVRRAEDAPEAVRDACRDAASRLGVRRRVRVVATSEVASPCLTGLLRPVVLLPAGMGLDALGPDLDAVLVHELTHVRNGDLVWNDALHLASIGLWFHPLAWRMRQSHAAACDAVCDAVAVDRLGDVATYGRALARLALRANASPPAHGLAMARACDVRRRIASLQRFVYRAPLPRRLVMPAFLVSAVFAALIGGAAVIRAQEEPPPAASKKADEPGKKTMTIRVVDAATGEPLPGVAVEYRQQVNGAKRPAVANLITGPDGALAVEYPTGVDLRSFYLLLRKPGFVAVPFWRWVDSFQTIVIPESQEFRLARGRTLVGEVVDETGAPIEGASVDLSMSAVGGPGSFSFDFASVKTDAQGHWRTDEAPEVIDRVNVGVKHPDYRAGRADPGFKTTLTKGATVSGRVVGPDGKPVAAAKVALGLQHFPTSVVAPRAETDAAGMFSLRKLSPEPSFLVVLAEGFSVQVQDVDVMEKDATPPVEIRLGPAATIRGRVVDKQGKPIEGVSCQPNTWRGRKQLWVRIGVMKSDADGRFVWKNAPDDTVQFTFYREGYMYREDTPMKAGDAEQVVVMNPTLAISGSVVDAVTRRSIPQFTVLPGYISSGQPEPSWLRNDLRTFSDGRYEVKTDIPYKGRALRVEAPGYKPVVSRVFQPDEGVVTEDFALETGGQLEGVVLRPDGKPAAGVEVASRGSSSVAVEGPAFSRRGETEIVRTNPEGRFALPIPSGDYELAAVADAGVAQASAEEFAATHTLKMSAWGRIEGKVLVGRRPAQGVTVRYMRERPPGPSRRVDFDAVAQTDAEGRFSFSWVPPGPGQVCRLIGSTNSDSSSSRLCWVVPVVVEAGKVSQATIGGSGRPVVGRLVARDGKAVDWTRLKPVVLTQPPSREMLLVLRLGSAGFPVLVQYGSGLDADGRFRIDDVPPGAYELIADTSGSIPPGATPLPTFLTRTSKAVDVPDGDQAQPVDVGDVVVEVDRPTGNGK
ncbi:carboxypeptidase regulatory-like domain-containing protein [Paludisphaera rhizosphaerae]|uniref:carboxypeptidase regulatory-like domain-containing protein n=1 Tax=Paludisphaera rhizosphaerae TaxID=2711216 RepID=UPI0013EBCB9C|nr:carboxypeptidase regulatory-like domain-containing protein [Paludisphaera rhizosphaerae]